MVESPYSRTGLMNVSSSLAFMNSARMLDRSADHGLTSCLRDLVTLCFIEDNAVPRYVLLQFLFCPGCLSESLGR